MSFDSIEISSTNLMERAFSRILIQLRNSPVFLDVLNALISEVQSLLDATVDVIKLRGPADASAEQLNALGRIVGQMRSLIGYDTIAWFKPDTDYTGFDSVPFWVQNAPISGDVQADDAWYRALIEAKVSRNFIKYASVPEIQMFVRQALDMDISFVVIDTMTIQIIVPDETDANKIALLERYDNQNRVEHVYFLPLAACVRIGSVVKLSDYYDSSSSSS